MAEVKPATKYNSTLKPVNMPQPLVVEERPDEAPVAVGGKYKQKIEGIEDRWRIDDEWWRKEPISRTYYSVVLTSGQRLTIFRDHINKLWYRQSY